MVTHWLIRYWKLLVAIALFILLVIIGSTIWITITSDHWFSKLILKYFNSWSTALGAAAMVTLAIVAFASIIENRRIRAEERETDSKRKTLDGIVNWVIQINKDCVGPAETGEKAYKEWCKGITLSMVGEGKWVFRNSNIFGAEFSGEVNNLLAKIMNLDNKIKEIGRSGKYRDKESLEMLSGCFLSVLEATDIVLDAALKIRSDQKL